MKWVLRACLALPLLILGCGGLDDEEPGVAQSGMEREFRGFSIEETVEGRARWKLSAETAWKIPQQPDVHLDLVKVDFFDQQGDLRSWLTARRGLVIEETQVFTALDDVLVVSVEGDTLKSDELTYDRSTDLISGPGWVRIAKPDRILTGVGYQAKPDLSDYKVKENVRVILIDREKRLLDAP